MIKSLRRRRRKNKIVDSPLAADDSSSSGSSQVGSSTMGASFDTTPSHQTRDEDVESSAVKEVPTAGITELVNSDEEDEIYEASSVSSGELMDRRKPPASHKKPMFIQDELEALRTRQLARNLRKDLQDAEKSKKRTQPHAPFAAVDSFFLKQREQNKAWKKKQEDSRNYLNSYRGTADNAPMDDSSGGKRNTKKYGRAADPTGASFEMDQFYTKQKAMKNEWKQKQRDANALLHKYRGYSDDKEESNVSFEELVVWQYQAAAVPLPPSPPIRRVGKSVPDSSNDVVKPSLPVLYRPEREEQSSPVATKRSPISDAAVSPNLTWVKTSPNRLVENNRFDFNNLAAKPSLPFLYSPKKRGEQHSSPSSVKRAVVSSPAKDCAVSPTVTWVKTSPNRSVDTNRAASSNLVDKLPLPLLHSPGKGGKQSSSPGRRAVVASPAKDASVSPTWVKASPNRLVENNSADSRNLADKPSLPLLDSSGENEEQPICSDSPKRAVIASPLDDDHISSTTTKAPAHISVENDIDLVTETGDDDSSTKVELPLDPPIEKASTVLMKDGREPIFPPYDEDEDADEAEEVTEVAPVERDTILDTDKDSSTFSEKDGNSEVEESADSTIEKSAHNAVGTGEQSTDSTDLSNETGEILNETGDALAVETLQDATVQAETDNDVCDEPSSSLSATPSDEPVEEVATAVQEESLVAEVEEQAVGDLDEPVVEGEDRVEGPEGSSIESEAAPSHEDAAAAAEEAEDPIAIDPVEPLTNNEDPACEEVVHSEDSVVPDSEEPLSKEEDRACQGAEHSQGTSTVDLGEAFTKENQAGENAKHSEESAAAADMDDSPIKGNVDGETEDLNERAASDLDESRTKDQDLVREEAGNSVESAAVDLDEPVATDENCIPEEANHPEALAAVTLVEPHHNEDFARKEVEEAKDSDPDELDRRLSKDDPDTVEGESEAPDVKENHCLDEADKSEHSVVADLSVPISSLKGQGDEKAAADSNSEKNKVGEEDVATKDAAAALDVGDAQDIVDPAVERISQFDSFDDFDDMLYDILDAKEQSDSELESQALESLDPNGPQTPQLANGPNTGGNQQNTKLQTAGTSTAEIENSSQKAGKSQTERKSKISEPRVKSSKSSRKSTGTPRRPEAANTSQNRSKSSVGTLRRTNSAKSIQTPVRGSMGSPRRPARSNTGQTPARGSMSTPRRPARSNFSQTRVRTSMSTPRRKPRDTDESSVSSFTPSSTPRSRASPSCNSPSRVTDSTVSSRNARRARHTASHMSSYSPRKARVPIYSRQAGTVQKSCTSQLILDLHGKRAGCERCLHHASPAERLKYEAEGHYYRINTVRGGCSRDCKLFPRKENEPPVRLCRQCFYDTHMHGKV